MFGDFLYVFDSFCRIQPCLMTGLQFVALPTEVGGFSRLYEEEEYVPKAQKTRGTTPLGFLFLFFLRGRDQLPRLDDDGSYGRTHQRFRMF